MRDGDEPSSVVAPAAAARPAGATSRHLTVDSCGTPGQRHLWARHSGRPGQPLVARLRVRPQMQLSCPETEAVGGEDTRSGGDATDAVEGQQRSRSSDGGLAQHRRRRLVLKTINRSWPTSVSVSATPAGPRDSRSVTFHPLTSFRSSTASSRRNIWRPRRLVPSFLFESLI